MQVAAGAGAQAVDGGEGEEDDGGDGAIAPGDAAQGAEVAGEGDGHRRHAAGLGDQQENPAIDEGHDRMVGLAEVDILPAGARETGGEFRPDEGAGEGEGPAEYPDAEDEERGVDVMGDDGGIAEDAGPDDASHDDHGGVEEAKLAADWRGVQGCRLPLFG